MRRRVEWDSIQAFRFYFGTFQDDCVPYTALNYYRAWESHSYL
jgi:hypothetical protein